MRELLMEEYQFVAGGSDSSGTQVCEELAEEVKTTLTADGLLTGAAIATLWPGVGSLVGGAIAAASLIGGSILASEVEEACENHQQLEDAVTS